MAQAVECLLRKCKGLSSNPNPNQKKKKKKKERKKEEKRQKSKWSLPQDGCEDTVD
jgi:hypothetical protein